MLISVGGTSDKKDLLKPVQLLLKMGYTIFATRGTAKFLTEIAGVAKSQITVINKMVSVACVRIRLREAKRGDAVSVSILR